MWAMHSLIHERVTCIKERKETQQHQMESKKYGIQDHNLTALRRLDAQVLASYTP